MCGGAKGGLKRAGSVCAAVLQSRNGVALCWGSEQGLSGPQLFLCLSDHPTCLHPCTGVVPDHTLISASYCLHLPAQGLRGAVPALQGASSTEGASEINCSRATISDPSTGLGP